MKEFQCPNCGGDNLRVVVTVLAQLMQDDDGGNLQTVTVDDTHEWDGDSMMWCATCPDQEAAPAAHFQTEEK